MGRFQQGLRRFADHPLVGEVRGVGLIAGVELVRDKTTKTPFDASVGAGNILTSETVKHGLILRQIGDTLGFSPPWSSTRPKSTRCWSDLAKRSTPRRMRSPSRDNRPHCGPDVTAVYWL